MKIGYIPENLMVFARPETDFKFDWDDVQNDDAPVTKCKQIYVTDSANEKTQDSAERWAQGYHYNKALEFTTFECKNDFVKSVRIIGLDIRGQGGRAYMALINEEYLFDMREDVMLDTMINTGITPGAVLPGSYIFALIGSQMKLIRTGSLLHDKMIEATAYKAKKAITQLDVGGIYTNKIGTYLYLGTVYTRYAEQDDFDSSYDHRFCYNRVYKYSLSTSYKRHCVIQLDAVITSLSELESRPTITFSEKKSTSYRDKVGQVFIDDMQAALNIILKKSRAEEYFESERRDEYRYSYAPILNISTTPGYIHPLIYKLPNLTIL